MTTDICKIYGVVLLPEHLQNLHRFVWRENPKQPLVNYCMTRLTFGVSASSFATNMAMWQNAIDNKERYPLAAQAVLESLFMGDGLTRADSE